MLRSPLHSPLLLRAVVVCTSLAVSGCATAPQSTDRSQPSPVTGTTQTLPAQAESVAHAPLAPTTAEYAIYEGFYTCAGNKTPLKLKININDKAADAIFEFQAKRAVRGSFAMQGTYNEKIREIKLNAGNWIEKPPNFQTVSLIGAFNADRSRLKGRVIGCSLFEVRKTGVEKIVTNRSAAASVSQYSNCKVKASVIEGKYTGECSNGWAHGRGTAVGKDKYVGDFLDGKRHGKGVYSFDSSRYEGEFANDMIDGFGIFYIARDHKYLKHWEWDKKGRWIGDFYVTQGMTINGKFAYACVSQSDCEAKKEAKAKEPQVIRANGILANSPQCEVEFLREYFEKPDIPKWYGLCWDGKAQGPGALAYQTKGDFFKYEYYATGLVINGKFRSGPELSNARTREDNGGRVLDLKKLDAEEFEFFEKFEKADWVQFPGGCRLVAGGFFERPWVDYFRHRESRFGSTWVDSKGINYGRAGVIPRSVRLTTPCTGEFLQGRTVLDRNGSRLTIDNVVDGVPVGKITLEDYEKFPIFFWYYKGIWFDKYKEYQETVAAFDRYFKKSSTQAASKKSDIIKKGISIWANTPEQKYEAERSFAEAFDVKLALSASAQEPSRWNDSFMGMSGEGVKTSTDFYLHYKISPKKNFAMPKDVTSIRLELDTAVIMTKNVAMGWIGRREDEHFSSVVSMTLDRNKGFAQSGKLKVFDVRTFTSWGADKGLRVAHDNARPQISIKSVEVK